MKLKMHLSLYGKMYLEENVVAEQRLVFGQLFALFVCYCISIYLLWVCQKFEQNLKPFENNVKIF